MSKKNKNNNVDNINNKCEFANDQLGENMDAQFLNLKKADKDNKNKKNNR